MQIEIRQVDYEDPQQTADLCSLLNEYAIDPQGGGQAIADQALQALPDKLRQFPTSLSFILYVDDKPAALTNCFYGFSTFAARPLINIHDLVVRAGYRGKGLSQRLLQHIEQVAVENDCCKLTLEVLDKNAVAMNAYKKFGFAGYELDPTTGQAVFWQKKI
jgi:GNAT superfamily N-acetyltransferase